MSIPNTELILRELLRDRPEQVVRTAIAARKAVLKATGKCSELIYETYCISNAFTFTGKQGQGFIHIATYSKHVNLGFDRGAELEDPDELLEGTGKSIRHVRLSGVSDLKRPAVMELIRGAVRQGLDMAEKSKTGRVAASVTVKRRSN